MADPEPDKPKLYPFTVVWPKALLTSDPDGQPMRQQRWSMCISTARTVKANPWVQVEQHIGNPYEHSIFLRKIRVWKGVSLPSAADVWSRAWVCGQIYDPPMVIWSHNWDRYGPTTWHEPFEDDFGDGYVELVQGGWITVDLTVSMRELEKYQPQDYPAPTVDAQFMLWFNSVRP